MRINTLQQPQITRSQFLRSYTRFPVNHIAVEPSAALISVVPYVGKTGFTPTDSFYKHVSHETVQINAAHWHLHVGGLVSQPSNFSLDEMQALSAIEMPCTLTAITSRPSNLLIGHALWRGVPVKSLLDDVGLLSESRYAQFRSVNGYATYLPINLLENAVLAYAMNGESLPVEQGYPVRLIVPGVYDYKMPKWVQSIELVAEPSSGHYESRGWSANGKVQTTSALFTPRLREIVGGKVSFSGMAFAGTRTITHIDLSIDDGEWMPVPFAKADSGSWTRWQIEWQPHAPGDYLAKVRATDSEGFTQPNSLTLPMFPNGSSAIHAVVFRVSM